MLETNLNTQDKLQTATLAGILGGALMNLAIQLSLRGGSPATLISDKIIGTGGKMVRYIMMPDGVSVDDSTLRMVENASMDVFRRDSEGVSELLNHPADSEYYVQIHRVPDNCDTGEVTGRIDILNIVPELQYGVSNNVIITPLHNEGCDVPDSEPTFIDLVEPVDGLLHIQVADVTTKELDLVGGNYHVHDSNDLDLGPIHLDIPDFLEHHFSFPGTIQLTSALLSVASGVVIALATRGISEIRNRRNNSK